MIFTHFGISGPVVFALSSWCAYEEISTTHPLWCRVVFGDIDTFEARLIQLMNDHPKRQFLKTFIEATGTSERLISSMYKKCIHTGTTENTRTPRQVREEWVKIWKK